MTMKTIVAIAAAALAFGLAHAQDYPTKTIRMIIPLTPGSGADIAGRIIDLCPTAFSALAPLGQGVAHVEITW